GRQAGVVADERPAQSVRSTPGRVTMAATGLSLLGVSLLLFARSPFRMPVGERLFRLVWLGPVGEAFLKVSGRSVERRATGTTLPRATGPQAKAKPNTVSTPPPQPVPPDRIASLEE